ncbi:MAG TPA: FxLYD domain-containing protein [Symbiobacteriaceae bacterium]|nr:FxLYD domain-containing protein [Symbiobacteriaceae bacterium]
MLLHLELGHYADLPGFEGPYFQAPGPNAEPGAVHLLTESITQSKEGLWQAWGLVRNQMNKSVGNVVVTASLFGQDGALLAKAPATVPIANLRPGEPGPFHVTTQVPAAKVKRAEFALQPGEAKPVSRDLLLMKYWELPYDRVEVKGVRRRDAVWRHGRRVYPYKLGTGFQNIGERPVPGANLLLAWLNDQDQVVWVEQTTMDPSFAGPISPKGFAHFRVIQVDDPKMGPRLYDLTPMYWVVGA